jgi:hypothetical protein
MVSGPVLAPPSPYSQVGDIDIRKLFAPAGAWRQVVPIEVEQYIGASNIGGS